MPTYPTPSEYQEAIQFPEDVFRDPELQRAHPDENALGLPQPITGNFAAVFPMTTRTGRRWAVKCFLTEVPDQQQRYRRIAAHLDAHELPYTAAFDYQKAGIEVDGAVYPILKMEWAEGVPLNRFVETHLDAPATLAQLTEAWAAMLEALEAAEVAHSDLQHGNVLVRETDDAVHLTLVDYDTMVVPGLDRGTSPEVGHRNYQHPDRTEEDVGLYLDRFPGLVVFTALRACIARPELWARFDTGENLLFRAADFYDPSASVLFETLDAEEDLAPLVEALRTACYVEPEDVPTLEAVRGGTTEAPAWYEVRPAAARRRRERSEATRAGFARWFLPAAIAVVGAVVALALVGLHVAAGALAGGGLAVGGWSAWWRYRQLSLVRRHRRLREEEAHFDALIRSLERQIASLQAKRREVIDSVDARREQRLQEMREEALYDRLKHHFIGEVAGVEGVTHKHVIRLKKADIRTAYEAKPEHIEPIRTLGEKTTARIAMWRAALVAEYEKELPEKLSPAEERRIQRYVERRVDDIEREVARAREKIRVQEEERARVQERRDAMPQVSFGRYLRYLLRLDTLPAPSAPPAPSAGPPPSADERQKQRQPAFPHGDDDRPWWTGDERKGA